MHQARLKDGTRRIVSVTEVVGMEGDVITLQDLFIFDYRAGLDERGRFRGALRSTGLRPRFADTLADAGHPAAHVSCSPTSTRAGGLHGRPAQRSAGRRRAVLVASAVRPAPGCAAHAAAYRHRHHPDLYVQGGTATFTVSVAPAGR